MSKPIKPSDQLTSINESVGESNDGIIVRIIWERNKNLSKDSDSESTECAMVSSFEEFWEEVFMKFD